MTPARNKYSMFPVVHHNLWGFYKRQSQAFWVPEELDLAADVAEFAGLPRDEQFFIKNVLAFFNQSDGIVNENLAVRFYSDVDLPEARAFYAMQIGIEAIHSETYSLLLETYVKDEQEKNALFDAIATVPAVKLKADWAFKWMESDAPFAQRLFAFAIIEGVFFSGSFCAIYWLKSRGLLPGLSKANDYISRDEGEHWRFAAELFRTMKLHVAPTAVHSIVREAVDIEKEFVSKSLPVSLIGMNAHLMSQYIEYSADRLLQTFGMPCIYNTELPFDFMRLIDMEPKSNFFEMRVAEYSKGANRTLSFDDTF